jgi:hypothetical protein
MLIPAIAIWLGSWSAREVANLQVLKIDDIILAHQLERRLMMKVVALPTDLLMLLAQKMHRFAAALAALLATGHPPLRLLELPLRFAVVRGFSTASPADVIRNTFNPTSMPVSRPVAGRGSVGTSAQEKQTYQPSASWIMVTVLTVPTRSRLHFTAIRPILERTNAP